MTREFKSSKCFILQSRECKHEFSDEEFTSDYWRHQPGHQATVGGRGGSYLIDIDGRQAILRRYQRGGHVGKLLSDQYLWLGWRMTRPWREWHILQRALKAGLPVPEPIAACACRSGLWYRAALINAYLEDTEMLTQRLQREKLPPESWHNLGLLVKRMHAEGIRHADLTSDNVLIDSQNRFYLIDFDQARVMNQIDDWQWQPLYRFQRSIDKRNRKLNLNYGEDDWQLLMDGYQS
jgi:3-deoxy-D-manno-octulosonic acid kinase